MNKLFNKINNENRVLELTQIAYDNYCFELEEVFPEKDFDPIKNITNFEVKKKVIDNFILTKVSSVFEKNILLRKKIELTYYNPAKFDKLTCLKLIICSSLLGYVWSLSYTELYEFYNYNKMVNDQLEVDTFIGIIRQFWDRENDLDFSNFENYVRNSLYKKN